MAIYHHDVALRVRRDAEVVGVEEAAERNRVRDHLDEVLGPEGAAAGRRLRAVLDREDLPLRELPRVQLAVDPRPGDVRAAVGPDRDVRELNVLVDGADLDWLRAGLEVERAANRLDRRRRVAEWSTAAVDEVAVRR